MTTATAGVEELVVKNRLDTKRKTTMMTPIASEIPIDARRCSMTIMRSITEEF